MSRIGLALAVLGSFALPEIAASQQHHNRRGQVERHEQIRERAKWRELGPTLRALDDCDNVSDETIDVLRHGYTIVNRSALFAEQANNRVLLSSLLSGLASQVTAELDMPPHLPNARGYTRGVKPPERDEYREQFQGEFRMWVRDGGRLPCTVRAEDVAWSYAPATGSECAGLSNDLVDALRRSSTFYGQDRWEVRQAVLEAFRASTETDCGEFTSELVAAARMLDP